jgi:hypothetical protein
LPFFDGVPFKVSDTEMVEEVRGSETREAHAGARADDVPQDDDAARAIAERSPGSASMGRSNTNFTHSDLDSISTSLPGER